MFVGLNVDRKIYYGFGRPQRPILLPRGAAMKSKRFSVYFVNCLPLN